MSADIVNLNKARKKKAREERAAKAQENRVRFGRTKAERKAIDTERKRIATEIDGARRQTLATGEADGEDER